MTITGKTRVFGLIGDPVAHSLSPRIHAAFAEQCGDALSYEAIELPVDGFANGIAELQRSGYRGLNVTVPFKRDAWELCDRLSPRAQTAGAVNTLQLHANGEIEGDNTDGVGLVRDLTENLGVDIGGRQVLILGAGGAVRGVLEPLLALAPSGLTIANRTPERAVALARDFSGLGKIRTVAYTQLDGDGYHLIINATAAGLSNQVPPIPPAALDPAGVCYDMMYNLDAPTAFVEWALAQGVGRSHDGLGMLVEQAAEAYALWRGHRPRTGAVLSALRSK